MMTTLTKRLIRGVLIGVIALAALLSGHPTPAAADDVSLFDLRDHPVHLIASYYNAIQLQDYARAYAYWRNQPPNGATLQQYAQGFSDVDTARALARLPVVVDVAAGTAHADVPVVVLTTLKDGGAEIFAGCFHVVKINAPVGDPPVIDPNWYIDSAEVQPATSVDFAQAAAACTFVESFPVSWGFDDQSSPLDLISSYYDAIAVHDFSRAYNYWQTGAPGQTLAEFAQGFAETGNVGVVAALSFSMGVGAGSAYASAPLLITSTDNEVEQLFVGCMVTRKSNVPVGDSAAPDPHWYLYSANIQPVDTLANGLQQVWDACSDF